MEITGHKKPKMVVESAARLLEIFPVELWENIFSQAQPRDVINVYYTLPEFSNTALLTLRSKFVFPTVLQLLLPYLPSSFLLERKFLLKCRIICKSWKMWVDSNLQNGASYMSLHKNKTWNPFSEFRTNLGTLTNIKMFKDHFQCHLKSGENPFPGRALFLYYPTNCHEYAFEVEQLFEIVGKHVWFCTLSIGNTEEDTDYSGCSRLLEFLPNRKFLCIYVSHSNAQYNQLTPKFPNLKCLKVRGPTGIPLMNAIIVQNPRTKVIVTGHSYVRGESMTFLESMPKLEELKISFESIPDLLQFANSSMSSPLKKLIIYLEKIERSVHWDDLATLFKDLERKFTNSLKYLHISFPRWIYHSATPACTLKLSQLTSLSLDMDVSLPIWLEFILPMKDTLEYLAVYCCHDPGPNFKEETVKFFSVGVHDNLENSNVWEVFTKLKEVRIYWREDFRFRTSVYKRIGNGIVFSLLRN